MLSRTAVLTQHCILAYKGKEYSYRVVRRRGCGPPEKVNRIRGTLAISDDVPREYRERLLVHYLEEHRPKMRKRPDSCVIAFFREIEHEPPDDNYLNYRRAMLSLVIQNAHAENTFGVISNDYRDRIRQSLLFLDAMPRSR